MVTMDPTNRQDLARWFQMALATVNAPRPHAITSAVLLDCLNAERPDPKWAPHVEAFLTEVSSDILHHLVLAGAFDFTTLKVARNVWGGEGQNDGWIDEMAGFEVGRHTPRRPAGVG